MMGAVFLEGSTSEDCANTNTYIEEERGTIKGLKGACQNRSRQMEPEP